MNQFMLSNSLFRFMTFDGLKHERFSLIPDMFDRTISLFSAGKTFSCTGWRVGYCIGPSHLIEPLIYGQSKCIRCFRSSTKMRQALLRFVPRHLLRSLFQILSKSLRTTDILTNWQLTYRLSVIFSVKH